MLSFSKTWIKIKVEIRIFYSKNVCTTKSLHEWFLSALDAFLYVDNSEYYIFLIDLFFAFFFWWL